MHWGTMQEWGAKRTWAFGLVLVVIAVLLVAVLLPEAGVDTTPTDSDVVTTAKQGVEGFNVKAFCRDADKVERSPSPDAGFTIQLTRNRGGVEETVTIIERDGVYVSGIHYYNTGVGQQSEPADVTGAKDCIDDRS